MRRQETITERNYLSGNRPEIGEAFDDLWKWAAAEGWEYVDLLCADPPEVARRLLVGVEG